MGRTLLAASALCLAAMCAQGQWQYAGGPARGTVQSLAASEQFIFAGTDRAGIFRFDPVSSAWTQTNAGMTDSNVTALAVFGARIFAGTEHGGAFVSTDNGGAWTPAGLIAGGLSSFAAIGTNVIAGTTFGTIWLSDDNGASWTKQGAGLPPRLSVNALAVLATYLFAGTSNGVYYSTDNGLHWSSVGLPGMFVHALAASGADLFAGTEDGVYLLSGGAGGGWVRASSGMTNVFVNALVVSGRTIIAGTQDGIFLSTDSGGRWVDASEGMSNRFVTSLAAGPLSIFTGRQDLFAGTFGSGVWKRPFAELTTSVINSNAMAPDRFSLGQNFPNPFNPSTTISFTIGAVSYVSLKIYDSSGREAAALVSGILAAGRHTLRWDASGMPSGVYFYRLRVQGRAETKKLTIIR